MRHLLKAAATMAVLALLLRVDSLFGVTVALLSLWALARVVPRRAVRDLSIQRTHPARLFHGEEAEVTLTATNGGRWPIGWVAIADQVPFDLSAAVGGGKWATSLVANEQRSFHYRVRGRRRGLYALGPSSSQTGDLFGVNRWDGPGLDATRLVVYPRIVPVGRTALAAAVPVPVLRALVPWHEDPTRLVGVRKYQTGDSVRRIHWPATARLGELSVKQYQPAIWRETVVCLDMTRSGYMVGRRHSAADLAVTVAASIVHRVIVEERLPAGLWASGYDPEEQRSVSLWLGPRSDRSHLMIMLEILAQIAIDAVRDFGTELAAAHGRFPTGATVAVVTGAVDDRSGPAIVDLRRRGAPVTAFVVRADPRTDWLHRLEREGVEVKRIEQAEDLEAL